jgi:hypothetical protein
VILTVVPITTVAPAVGEVIVETGGKVSVLVFAVLEPLFITKHPAQNRIELTPASTVRIPKTLG